MRFFACFLICLSAMSAAADPVKVCATVTDLGDLVRAVGGEAVTVTVFARGGDDPHFVEARPSFSKALAKADLLVVVGLELEIGWIPILQEQARNARIAVSGSGYVDASSVIPKIGVPHAGANRGDGDVHAGGNPHFLSDPVCGARVARLIADRLILVAPERREQIETNWRAFAHTMAMKLFGELRGNNLAADQLIAEAEQETAHPSAEVGGWFAALKSAAGTAVVADHDLWPYLAKRFGLNVVGFLEPKPGIEPTSRHLTALVELMQNQHISAILTTPYFDPQHARLVADRTKATIIPLAHQVGSLPDAADYLTTIDRNVRALAAGLAANK